MNAKNADFSEDDRITSFSRWFVSRTRRSDFEREIEDELCLIDAACGTLEVDQHRVLFDQTLNNDAAMCRLIELTREFHGLESTRCNQTDERLDAAPHASAAAVEAASTAAAAMPANPAPEGFGRHRIPVILSSVVVVTVLAVVIMLPLINLNPKLGPDSLTNSERQSFLKRQLLLSMIQQWPSKSVDTGSTNPPPDAAITTLMNEVAADFLTVGKFDELREFCNQIKSDMPESQFEFPDLWAGAASLRSPTLIVVESRPGLTNLGYRWVDDEIAGGLVLMTEKLAGEKDSDIERASESFRAILARNPESRIAQLNDGYILMLRRKYSMAFDRFRLMSRDYPDDAYTQLSLGLAAFGTGEYELAKQAFECVRELGPDSKEFQASISDNLRMTEAKLEQE